MLRHPSLPFLCHSSQRPRLGCGRCGRNISHMFCTETAIPIFTVTRHLFLAFPVRHLGLQADVGSKKRAWGYQEKQVLNEAVPPTCTGCLYVAFRFTPFKGGGSPEHLPCLLEASLRCVICVWSGQGPRVSNLCTGVEKHPKRHQASWVLKHKHLTSPSSAGLGHA